MTLEALVHGKCLPTANLAADEGSSLLVEGADVALQVESSGEGPVTAIPGALEDHSHFRVDVLMLPQKPRVPEHFAALVTLHGDSVLLLSVLQVLSPGLPCESAALLFAGVPSVHLLVTLQFTGEAKSHLAALISALIRGQLSVLLAHVGLQLFVLLELEPTALKSANIFPLLLAVHAADVSGPVCVGGEGLRAAIYGASERLLSAVAELVPRQVGLTAESLRAAIAPTRIRLHSRVFTQVSVQFPLFVISSRAPEKRADVTFV